MRITPLRIFILVDIIFITLVYNSSLNNQSNMAFGLMVGFPTIILLPLIIIELLLTMMKNKIPKTWMVLISLISIPLVIIGTWKFTSWAGDIENNIILPKDYKKNYLMIVYNVKTGKSIRPSFSIKRNRKLIFPDTGIFLTSTENKSSRDRLDYTRVFKSDGKEIKGKYYGGFDMSNGFAQGYKYSIIYLTEKFYGSEDSIFVTDKIDFNILDK